MDKEEMKKKIKEHINKIREIYMYMEFGNIPKDYEELLFQLEEGITKIINEEEE